MLHLTHQLPEYHAQGKQQISAQRKVINVRLAFKKTIVANGGQNIILASGLKQMSNSEKIGNGLYNLKKQITIPNFIQRNSHEYRFN